MVAGIGLAMLDDLPVLVIKMIGMMMVASMMMAGVNADLRRTFEVVVEKMIVEQEAGIEQQVEVEVEKVSFGMD